ncbi:hypothetical protein CF392_15620, partial [Tamilnaduibacter salinus]
MYRQFHDPEVLLSPASLIRRLLAMIYDGLISIAVVIVVTWGYTMLAAWVIGFDEYQQMAESGQLNTDPILSTVLFVTLYF